MPRRIIYLDHAAATPIDPAVYKVMQPYLTSSFFNPSATYGPAREVRAALESARAKIAHWLGARHNEIVFTAGGTEANNLAIHGIMRLFPDGNIVIGGIEHESVMAPAHDYDCREVAVGRDGRVDLEDLRSKIDDKTALVSIGYANNEIGTVQSLKEAAQIIREKRAKRPADRPIYLHTDACQAANHLDLHVSRIGVDMMTLNGGKIYGPKQSGALYVKAGVKLKPLIQGGGQERGLRSGTENVAAAVGLAAALDKAQAIRQEETLRLQALQKKFMDSLHTSLPPAKVNGSIKHRLANNVHVIIPGQDNERVLIQLEEAGILAAAGSACSASSQEPSHVLRAIGLSDVEARSALRFTLGRPTDESMVERTVRILSELTK